VVLDTKSGSTATIARNESFWCEDVPNFKIIAIQGEASSGTRVSEPEFHACSAEGSPFKHLPATNPTTVGVVLDGEFIWASPKGLVAVNSNR
jgi:hypothetical protein